MSNEKTKEIRPFGAKDKLGYMFGDFGNDFTFQFASSYLLVFYTKVLGIGAGVIGTFFLLARCVDAFTDVAMGNICDSSKPGKDGRFRPWIRRMCIPVALASTLMYNYFIADWSMTAKMVYVVITYIVYGSICYTGINIPYGSMASVMTLDAKERTSLSTFRTIGAMLAGLFVGILAPMFIYVKDTNGNSVASGPRFLILALVFGVLAVICYMLCYNMCQERVELPTMEKSKENSIFTDLKDLAKDKAFWVVILTALLSLVAGLSSFTLNQYLFLDYFGNTSYLSVMNMISLVGALSMAPLAGKLTQRFGKKEAGAVSLLITGIVYIIVFILHVSNPLTYIALLFVSYISFGYYSMVTWAYLSDVIDNYQVNTGKRKDGTVYAVYSFARKLGQAVAGGIGGWALAWVGYNSLATVQTTSVKNGIFTITLMIPAVCYILSGLLLMFVYPLTKEKVIENQKTIENMRK